MAQEDFHDVRFPPDISYGSTGGPKFSTTVQTTAAGFEKRNRNWSQQRCEFNVRHGIKDDEQMEKLLAFFFARQGKAFGFRYKDWADFQASNQLIAMGDGTKTEFQLVKRYVSGPAQYVREITKPVVGSVSGFFLAGTHPITGLPYQRNLSEGAWFDFNYDNGSIRLLQDEGVDWRAKPGEENTPTPFRPLAPGVGLYVTSFEFDVPVRFDTDHAEVEQDSWRIQNWDKIPLVEIRIR